MRELRQKARLLRQSAAILGVPQEELLQSVRRLQKSVDELEAEITRLKK